MKAYNSRLVGQPAIYKQLTTLFPHVRTLIMLPTVVMKYLQKENKVQRAPRAQQPEQWWI